MEAGVTGETPVLSVEDRLEQVAQIMAFRGMSALLIDGRLEDERPYEGLRLLSGDLELGQVRFVDGALVSKEVDAEKIKEQRDLMTAGLTIHVLQEVIGVALDVYGQGGDFLDERFDVLPGFNS